MLSNPGRQRPRGQRVLFAKALTLFANNAAYGRLSRRSAARAPGCRRRGRASRCRDGTRPTRSSQSTSASTDAGFCSQPRPNLRHSRGRRSRSIGCSTPIDRRGGSSGRFGRGSARCPPIRQCPFPAACGQTQRPAQFVGRPRAASQLDGTYRWVITRADAHKYWGPQLNPGDTYPSIGTAILHNGSVAPGRPRRRPRHVHDPRQPPSVQLASGCLGAHLHVHPRRRWHLAFEAGAADGPRRSVRLGLQAVAADRSADPDVPLARNLRT